jgi:hypothetical protein
MEHYTVWDMDLLSEGTAPITADEAMMVIKERIMVRSRGNLKERIPGKAPIQLNKQPHGTTPSARSLCTTEVFQGVSAFLCVHSLTPFVFQYIFLSCHHLSYTHLLIPFVYTKQE